MSESKSLFGDYHEMADIWARIQAFDQVFMISSCLLTLATSISHMQSCFKIDLIFIKLSNVSFVCLKARVFLVTIMKWQGYKHLTSFS